MSGAQTGPFGASQRQRRGNLRHVPSLKACPVKLVPAWRTVDAAVTAHVETQARLTSMLSDEDKAALNGLLAKYLAGFEGDS
ncbi:hypothetical protein [Ferruginivarius sediminum]|uniref:hypothetical protein n=1 Tax=Ferruginivarius sediminum TaxID=2661937 RepID=UPI0019D45156|nr:hypothetical protein [Ferruginivarius sediminum]